MGCEGCQRGCETAWSDRGHLPFDPSQLSADIEDCPVGCVCHTPNKTLIKTAHNERFKGQRKAGTEQQDQEVTPDTDPESSE